VELRHRGTTVWNETIPNRSPDSSIPLAFTVHTHTHLFVALSPSFHPFIHLSIHPSYKSKQTNKHTKIIMGHITIFTIDDCDGCTRIKSVMDKRCLPYVEINLSAYPSRRKDMIQLLASSKCKFGLLDTPVIFFNEECIGGAQETWNRLRQWDQDPHMTPLEMYEYTIAAAMDANDPRLREPSSSLLRPEVSQAARKFQSAWLAAHLVVGPTTTHSSFVQSSKNPADEEESSRSSFSFSLLSPRSSRSSVSAVGSIASVALLPAAPPPVVAGTSILQITQVLKSVLTRQDLSYHMTTYKKSFRASHAIVAIGAYYKLSPDEALDFCQSLQQEYQILDHVCGDHVIANTEALFFRLTCDQRPHVLNSFRVWDLDHKVVLAANRPSAYWGSIDTSSAFSMESFSSSGNLLEDEGDGDNKEGIVSSSSSSWNYKYAQLLYRLHKFLSKIMQDKTSSGWINYKSCAKHELYPVFEEAICELQMIQLERMSPPYKLVRRSLEYHSTSFLCWHVLKKARRPVKCVLWLLSCVNPNKIQRILIFHRSAVLCPNNRLCFFCFCPHLLVLCCGFGCSFS
jgi:glutaredoxin